MSPPQCAESDGWQLLLRKWWKFLWCWIKQIQILPPLPRGFVPSATISYCGIGVHNLLSCNTDHWKAVTLFNATQGIGTIKSWISFSCCSSKTKECYCDRDSALFCGLILMCRGGYQGGWKSASNNLDNPVFCIFSFYHIEQDRSIDQVRHYSICNAMDFLLVWFWAKTKNSL